jgi:hypothetical protein
MSHSARTDSRSVLFRICAAAGIGGALITFVFGILHPKGTADVGSVSEWMTRVSESDVWILVHFMLAWASVLILVAIVGIAHSYEGDTSSAWARVGLLVAAVTTAIGVMTFLIDGAVVKHIADRWILNPDDPVISGAARLATEIGFILVAGLQLTTGMVAFIFGIAGLAASSRPHWLPWLALLTAFVAIITGSTHYLFGASTWAVNASYVSNGLFAIWVLAMSRQMWRGVSTPAMDARGG